MLLKKIYIALVFFTLIFITISHFVFLNNEIIEEEKTEVFITNHPTVIDKENDFIGVLEIPKINLKRGFYPLDSKKNNVDKNIQIIETSLFPNVEKSNLILASHSGSSKISFFKNLYKLKLGDKSYIYYNEKKYVYELQNKYDELKDGKILIKRDKNKTTLTLVTCDKKNKTLQNVYIFYLVND